MKYFSAIKEGKEDKKVRVGKGGMEGGGGGRMSESIALL